MIKPQDNHDEIIYTSALRMTDEPKLNPIPSDIILDKTIPGWGATYGEIKADRNSIIILPHKSQIYSKNEKHSKIDNTCPVTEKMNVTKLVKYIKESKRKKLKFLSTPEGLVKVIKAIHLTRGNPYKDFFILIDECHKLSKDIGYRGDISAAMNDFFMFEGKAMISATPIKPSDPRFYHFKFVKVVHERKILKDIHLRYVNNLGAAFKEYIDNYEGKLLFVFLNSLDGINSLINLCNLQEGASIYCSEDGVKDFALKEMYNAYSTIDINNIAFVNFLTSSFYNGLDIEGLHEIPDVLILTDIKYRDHTIIDPNIDTFQILGRFRPDDYEKDQSDRINSATHIINTKHRAMIKLEDNAIAEFEISRKRYHLLLDLQAAATDPFLSDVVYGESLKRCKPYYNMLDRNGDFDWFKYDNYLYEHRVKMCYGDEISPGLTYIMSELYNITESKKIYIDGELEKMSSKMGRYSKEGIRYACEKLIANENLQGVEGADEYYTELCRRYPLVVRAVKILGYEKIEELEFRKSAIQKAMTLDDIKNKRLSHGMFELVYRSFMVGVPYTVNEVKVKLQKLFDEAEIPATAKGTDIKTYFKIDSYTGHKPVPQRASNKMNSEFDEQEEPYLVDGKLSKSIRMIKLRERKYNTINFNSNRDAQNSSV